MLRSGAIALKVKDLIVGDMIALEEGEGLAEVPFTKDGRGSLRIVTDIFRTSDASESELFLMDLDCVTFRCYVFEGSRLVRVYR